MHQFFKNSYLNKDMLYNMKHTFNWDLQLLCKHLYNMVNIYDHEFIILSTITSVQ
jgi:hypothetical protein